MQRLIAFLLWCLFCISPAAVHAQWAFSIPNTGQGIERRLALDSFGNIYTSGAFEGTADFDPGPGTVTLSSTNVSGVLAKYDRNGNYLWASITPAAVSNIAVGPSASIYTTGSFLGTVDFDPGPDSLDLVSQGIRDAFVAKYDTDGNLLWAFGLGSSVNTDKGWAIDVDSSENVYVVGYFAGTVDFDPGPGETIRTRVTNTDLFVAKYDTEGNFLWVFTLPASSTALQDLVVDDAGNIYLAGQSSSRTDFDPGPGEVFPSVGSSTYLAHYDSGGNFIWVVDFNTSLPSSEIQDVAIDGSGNSYLVGSTNINIAGSGDAFVAKYTADGVLEWAFSFGDSSRDTGYGVDVDGAGNVFVAGRLGQGTIDVDPSSAVTLLTISPAESEAFVAKYDADGNYQWAFNTSGQSHPVFGGNEGYDIVVDDLKGVYVTGLITGPTDFDPGSDTFELTVPEIPLAIFIAKYSDSGSFPVANEEAAELPSTYTLSAIHPNPFYTQARFFLTVQHSQSVRVEMFDVLGRSVALVEEARLPAGLEQAFEIRRGKLASGLYMVRIVGEHFTNTRQIILL